MSTVRAVEVSQDILDSARLTPSELKVEMAVHLYTQGRLSGGKARELADMTLVGQSLRPPRKPESARARRRDFPDTDTIVGIALERNRTPSASSPRLCSGQSSLAVYKVSAPPASGGALTET